MKAALAALFSSKKFLTMLIGLVVVIGAKFGLQLDTEIVASIVGLFAILVGAQGAADLGKEAKKATTPDTAPALSDRAIIDALRRNPGALQALLAQPVKFTAVPGERVTFDPPTPAEPTKPGGS